MRVLIDSSVFIDILRKAPGSEKILREIVEKNVQAYFSVVAEAELLSGKECENTEKRRAVKHLLSYAAKVLLTNEIAEKAGELRRTKGISLLDAVIAATAISLKIPVATANAKDFEKSGVQIIKF